MNRLTVLFSAACALLAVSCKNNANQTPQTSDVTDEDSVRGPVVIRIDDIKPYYDVITRENIIEDVKYIPLETNEKSLIGGGNIYKIGGNYVVEDREVYFRGVKVFGPDGSYIEDSLIIGNGPSELPMSCLPVHDFINKRLLYFGSGKVIMLDLTTHKKSVIRADVSLDLSNMTAVLGNGDLISPDNSVAQRNNSEKGWHPLYYFLDSDFNVSDTVFSYRALRRLIEGKTEFTVLTSNQVYKSDRRILCRSLESDTVFEVNNDRSFTPAIILDIPENLMPTVSNLSLDSRDQKAPMFYIRDLFESKDYVFVTYQHAGLFYTGIWEKESGRYVASSAASFGSTVIVPVDNASYMYQYKIYCVEWETNTIVTSVPANVAKDQLPGLKPDDNPVVVEIKFKSPSETAH